MRRAQIISTCQLPSCCCRLSAWRRNFEIVYEWDKLLCVTITISSTIPPTAVFEEWALSCRLSLLTHLYWQQQWVIIAFCWAIESISLLLPCHSCSHSPSCRVNSAEGRKKEIVKWRWQTHSGRVKRCHCDRMWWKEILCVTRKWSEIDGVECLGTFDWLSSCDGIYFSDKFTSSFSHFTIFSASQVNLRL